MQGTVDPKLNRVLTYYHMLKEFRLKPNEVDDMDNITLKEIQILANKHNIEERRAMK